MKEREILMTAAMVLPTLAGTKTETRRTRGLEEINKEPGAWTFLSVQNYARKGEAPEWRAIFKHRDGANLTVRCPYGGPGDALWVRETFRFGKSLDKDKPKAIGASALEAGYPRAWAPTRYEADGAMDNWDTLPDFGGDWGKTRVSIHMPRWASRITLGVAEVRVERLHDITGAGAKAEGLKLMSKDGKTWKWGIPDRDGLPGGCDIGWVWTQFQKDPRTAYMILWESINGPLSWDANPWVCVVVFNRIAQPEAAR